MTRQTAIIWVWGLVLIAGAVGGGFVWWRQQDVAQAHEAARAAADADRWEEALTLAQPYAGRDDPRINGLLADAYINGPDSIQDIDKGLTLRRRAAEAGDMRAAYFLGKWILENEPTDAQAQEAIGYIQEAADCGMPEALLNLSNVYFKAIGTERNLDVALVYAEKAGDIGVSKGAWNTFLILVLLIQEEGHSMQVYNVRLVRWLVRASMLGQKEASEQLEEIRHEIKLKDDLEAKEELEFLEQETSDWVRSLHPVDPLSCLSTY
jgi:TPR repeat protein